MKVLRSPQAAQRSRWVQLLLLLTSPFAHAESPLPNAGATLVQVALGLGLVVLLLIGALWLLKRLSAPRGAAAGLLRVVAGAAVGQRERVVVVEIADTWLVLGVAPGQVRALHQLPRQASPAEDTAAPVNDFANRLKQAMQRKHAH